MAEPIWRWDWNRADARPVSCGVMRGEGSGLDRDEDHADHGAAGEHEQPDPPLARLEPHEQEQRR